MKLLLTSAVVAALFAGSALAHPPQRHDRGLHRGWHKGDRVDRDEWRRWEYIDWRHHHLHEPPPGYEWRRCGDQYFQIAISTGHIGAVLAIR